MTRRTPTPRTPDRGPALLLALALLLVAIPGPRSVAVGQPTPGTAGDDPPAAPALALAEAVAAALASNPVVGEARHRRSAAAAGIDEARADRRPEAGLRGSALRYQEPVPTTPIHGFGPGEFPGFDRTVGQAELFVRYDLYDGGADDARRARAEAEAEAAAGGLAAVRDRVTAATVAGFVEVLANAAVLDAHDRRIAALEAERDRVEQLFTAGRAAEVDRRRIAAARAGAAADRVALATDLDTAERALARLTGLPVVRTRAAALRPVHLQGPPLPPHPPDADVVRGAGGTTAGEPPATQGPGRRDLAREDLAQEELEREELARRALAAHPEVARAAAEVAAAETAVELARSRRRPTVGARGAWQEFADGGGRVDGEWLAGVELTVPLFDGGRVAARVRAAAADRNAAEARLEAARLGVLEALDRALAEGRRASARVAALEEAVAGYAEVVRVEALRLRHGTGTQSDYLDAEADLLGARAALARARLARIVAHTEVARATGTLDLDWIDTHFTEAP